MRSFAVALPIVLLSARVIPLLEQVQGCADTQYPPELPNPNVLVDSAHAIDDLGAFADPAKPMVFSVVFNPGDSVAKVRALDKSDAAAAVSLTNYVRHQPPGELWAFRVRVAGGDAPALTLARSTYCPPVTHSGRSVEIVGSISSVMVGSNPTPLAQQDMSAPVIPVEALIAVDGAVVQARVLKTTGNTSRDAQIVRDLKRQGFDPAKLDGQPIQAIYRQGAESPRP